MAWYDYPPGPIGWIARTIEGDWGDDEETKDHPAVHRNSSPGDFQCVECGYGEIEEGGDCSVCGGKGTGISKESLA